jgi:hypothetical protein
MIVMTITLKARRPVLNRRWRREYLHVEEKASFQTNCAVFLGRS